MFKKSLNFTKDSQLTNSDLIDDSYLFSYWGISPFVVTLESKYKHLLIIVLLVEEKYRL